jgi:hypothetical protein
MTKDGLEVDPLPADVAALKGTAAEVEPATF